MIKNFILDHMVMIYKGTLSQKFVASVQLSVAPAAAITLTERLTNWYIESEFFMFLLCIVIMIDHIVGSIRHWLFDRDFTFKENLKGLILKLGVIIAGFLVLSTIDNILSKLEFFKLYFSVLVQLIVILYPGSSALSNLSIITNGKFPPNGFLEKIKNFNKSADIEDLKNEK